MCQVKIQYSYAILSNEILRPTDVLIPNSVLVVLAFLIGPLGVVLARKQPTKILLTVVTLLECSLLQPVPLDYP